MTYGDSVMISSGMHHIHLGSNRFLTSYPEEKKNMMLCIFLGDISLLEHT